MKHLFASTALVALLAAPAFAQSEAPATTTQAPEAQATEGGPAAAPVTIGGDIMASDFIGRRVYAGKAPSGDAMANPDAKWENIGEVSDILFTEDWRIAGVLVDVGGFLGVGEHRVEVDMGTLSFVQDADDPNSVFIVSSISREELEALPEYDATTSAALGEGRPSTTGGTAATGGAGSALAPTASTPAPAPEGGVLTGDAGESSERVGTDAANSAGNAANSGPEWVKADAATLAADDLEGASVHDLSDERVGEIGELIVDADGKITEAVVDVGGYLGIGEKPVALPFEKLQVMQSQDGSQFHVVVDETRETLEAMPAHKS